MLQKFLIVGVGGSGGKTLRILREQLENRLQRAGIQYWPKAWQLIHIDVPEVPDGDEADLPDQLPAGSYLGLAPQGLGYQTLDEGVVRNAKGALHELANWRPEPNSVHVPPTFGAGQFRAVGRVVTLASLAQVATKLREAIRELDDRETGQQLDEVTRKLGGDPSPKERDPMVIVVSSIAGGAGSGGFMDICDVIRSAEVGRAWLDRSLAVLYTPDVFASLPAPHRAGVQGNALAAVSELMAGYWGAATNDPVFNSPQGTPELVAVASGIGGAMPSRSGPRYPFLVGRSNGEVTFSTQNQVYRVVARTLSALVTSQRVQDGISAYTFANWSSTCASVKDMLPLSDTDEKPFSSFGYASIGLGRDRFAQYTAERLARKAVETILRGHRDSRVESGEQTEQMAIEELANTYRFTFIEECGLRELGLDHNQILDAIRGGSHGVARNEALLALRKALRDDVTKGKQSLQPDQTAREILARYESRKSATLAALRESDRKNAERWVLNIQKQVEKTVAQYMGRVGGHVTARLLEMSVDELNAQVVPELRKDASDLRNRFLATLTQRVQGPLLQFKGEMLPENPQIDKAIKEAADALWAEIEADLHELVSGLIEDLTENYVRRLRGALQTSLKQLEDESVDKPDKISKILQWPVLYPPESLKPPQNEILLESVDDYPEMFDAQITKLFLADAAGNAVDRAVREIIGGDGKSTLLDKKASWAPRHGLDLGSEAAAMANFTIKCSAADLIERAYKWLDRPNTPLTTFLSESLADYLGTPGDDQESRLSTFRAAFAQVLKLSQPLVAIDPAIARAVHPPAAPGDTEKPARVMSAVPFPVNHPARALVREILLADGMTAALADDVFADGNDQRIEISTFLGHPCEPVVFREGLISPIADFRSITVNGSDVGSFWKWRRTRPLPQFIPMSGRRRLEMIRGWFVARSFGMIEITNYATSALSVSLEDGSDAQFPFPLMTASPIKSNLDLLPAVLESVPVALIDYARIGDLAMNAYTRLSEFGKMMTPDAPETSPLSGVLKNWIMDGVRPKGSAPIPNELAGTTRESQTARVDSLLLFLNMYLDGQLDENSGDRFGGYRGLLNEVPVPGSLDRMGGAWELRQDLVMALEQISGMVTGARLSISRGGSIGIG